MPSSGRPYFRTFHRGFRCGAGVPGNTPPCCDLRFLTWPFHALHSLLPESPWKHRTDFGGEAGKQGSPFSFIGGSVKGNVNIQLNILMVLDYIDLYHPVLRDFACMTHYFQTDRTYIFVGLLSFSLLKSGFRHYTRFHHLKKGIELVPNLELKKNIALEWWVGNGKTMVKKEQVFRSFHVADWIPRLGYCFIKFTLSECILNKNTQTRHMKNKSWTIIYSSYTWKKVISHSQKLG